MLFDKRIQLHCFRNYRVGRLNSKQSTTVLGQLVSERHQQHIPFGEEISSRAFKHTLGLPRDERQSNYGRPGEPGVRWKWLLFKFTTVWQYHARVGGARGDQPRDRVSRDEGNCFSRWPFQSDFVYVVGERYVFEIAGPTRITSRIQGLKSIV